MKPKHLDNFTDLNTLSTYYRISQKERFNGEA
jgi:hypothetical protein